VFEADNLDEALELARHIPAARYACVEVWPMVHWGAPTEPVGNGWLALLLEPAEAVMTPGSAQWEEGLRQHGEFAKAAGDHILGGAPLHPPGTATTVTVRDGQTVFTDGPYVEGAEVRHAYLRRRIKECEIS
jgi:hypothetical protein